MINIQALNLDFTELNEHTLDLIVKNDDILVSNLESLNVLEFYTSLSSWLSNDFLDIFTYSQFHILSEDGESWTLECKDDVFIIDIDDTILAVWRLLAKIEVHYLKEYGVDLNK